MRKDVLALGVLGIIFMILLGILVLSPTPAKKIVPVKVEGIDVSAPLENAEVSSPLIISGKVTGNGWSGFEGQVGTVKLLDGNGKELTSGILKATTEWTTLPTDFRTVLNFSSPETEVGTLVFKNENASGIPEKDKTFTLPVI